MRHHPRAIAMLSLLLAAGSLTLAAGPTLAECPYFPIPPASKAIPSAREVIVGTVLENVGGQSYTYRLRVDVVHRGPAIEGEVRTIDSLYPGWPIAQTESGPLAPCEPIPGSPGNVMVLAYEALAPDGATRYTAAAWITGLPEYRLESEVERLTLEEVRALALLPLTDATEWRDPLNGSRDGSPAGLLLAAGVLGFVITTARSRRGETR